MTAFLNIRQFHRQAIGHDDYLLFIIWIIIVNTSYGFTRYLFIYFDIILKLSSRAQEVIFTLPLSYRPEYEASTGENTVRPLFEPRWMSRRLLQFTTPKYDFRLLRCKDSISGFMISMRIACAWLIDISRRCQSPRHYTGADYDFSPEEYFPA